MRTVRIAAAAAALAALLTGCAASDTNTPADTPGATTKTSEEPVSVSDNEKNPPARDIKVTSCKVDEFGLATAKLTITNHSSKPSDYTATVEFVDLKGTRVAQGAAFTSALGPGKTAVTDAVGDAQVKGKLRCKVVQVDRFASGG